MKIMHWMGAGQSRRNSRLWMMRLKKAGGAFAAVTAVCGMAAYGWHGGFFSRAGDAVREQTLAFTSVLGFYVGDIIVTGRDNISREELLTHLGISQGYPIFGVALDGARARILEIPWVKTVQVARRLPDALLVDIEERKAVALWQHQKKISAIDVEGVALTGENLGHYANLPLIVGDGAQGHVPQITGLLQAEPAIAEQLASAVRVGGRRWDLRLKNGVTIKLPENDVELALSKLASAEAKDGLLGKNVTAIDLRLPEKIVVALKDNKSGKPNI
jgi:cell division protein FtsQ